MAAFSLKNIDFETLADHVGRLFFFLFVPGGLIFLAALIFVESRALLHWLPVISMAYPYLVLGAAVLLGWRFNRSRLVMGVVVLVLVDRLFFHFAPDGTVASGSYKTIYNAICFLVPLNLALFYFLPEKGLMSANGLLRLVAILLQPPFVDFLRRSQQSFAASLNYCIAAPGLIKDFPMPQVGMAAFAVAFLCFLFMYFKKRGNREHGFIWALVAAFAALSSGRPGSATTIYFATAGLILVVALVEDAYCMAFRDELTGLPARRALDEALMQMPEKYAIGMLDIDFFKKFNDRHGHDVGDQVLSMVAAKLSKIKGGAKVYRYGGEEFTALFPGRSVGEALPFLEELRREIESASFYVRNPERPMLKPKIRQNGGAGTGKKLSVTISIGAAEPKGNKNTPQAVLKAADKALYRAKKKGRNQVSM